MYKKKKYLEKIVIRMKKTLMAEVEQAEGRTWESRPLIDVLKVITIVLSVCVEHNTSLATMDRCILLQLKLFLHEFIVFRSKCFCK